ncbi:MAG: cytochrome c oxidase subunit II [Planctomycetota bacterium]
MNASFRLFPEAASRSATEVDYLSLALLGITTVFSVGIAVAIVFFIARYWHARDVNRISSHSNLLHWIIELTWSIGPLIILLGMFVWGAAVYIRAHQPPENPIEVYVVAKQWMWKIGHQGGRREINALHVPIGTPVRLTMISEDVVHSFFVPAFRIKQDVLPGRYTMLWFEATKPGEYHLFCAEYCGTDHSRMRGKVVVQTPEEYARWLADEDVESAAQRGRRLVEALNCVQCHARLDGPQVGPPLTGLYGRSVALGDGRFVVADDAYIRRAILDPKAERRAGWSAVMPSYEGQLAAEQIMEITAYILSIADATGPLPGPDISPPDNEDAQP